MAKISRKALLIGAAAVALGIGAYAYTQDKAKKGTGNGKPIPRPPGRRPVGEVGDSAAFDDKVMAEDPDARFGYTTFFTQESEQIVTSDLQAWKNQHNIDGNCTWVTGFDPGEFGQGTFNDHLIQARAAAADVLQKRYPQGAWRPYNQTAGTPRAPGTALGSGHPRWQQWLFQRVENIARREVCSFVPPTS